MSAENEPPSPRNRRSSFAPGQRFSDMFSRSPPNNQATSSNTAGNVYPGPITAAAAQAHTQRRRLSVSTAGGSGSSPPNPASPFASWRPRRGSTTSSGGTSGPESPRMMGSESAIEDGESPGGGPPASPFARRMSFGARAMMERNGESGFNWSDQIRARAERSASMAGPPSAGGGGGGHHKAHSVAVPEAPKEIPKQPRAPDHFQERILKGDFYMD